MSELPIRWTKLARDLSAERGRVALMVAAILVSVTGLGTVLGAYGILTREMARAYLGTRPASATLELEDDARGRVAEVRARPEVAEAEARDVVLARVRVGEDWRPLLLFVVDDFNDLRLAQFRSRAGAWPPPLGTMLIEQTAGAMLESAPGRSVLVKTPHGPATWVPITGLVHDPGLAPAWQEREGYGYLTVESLAILGEAPHVHELRVTFQDGPFDRASIEASAQRLAQDLSRAGHRVHEIRIPPPGRHPHQSQMSAVLFLLLSFSGLGLILSAILVATTLAALLARQVREIGVIKAIGGSSGQIARLYAGLVLGLGLVAGLLALPLSVLLARAFATQVSTMLNFELESVGIPTWIYAVGLLASVLVPLLFAAIPIRKASRITVRAALDAHGVAPGQASASLGRWAARLGVTARLALRNALRRRGRLLLTVGLLAVAGAMFLTALSVSAGWERSIARVYQERHYDVEVRLHAPLSAEALAALRAQPGLPIVEAWGYQKIAWAQPGAIDVVQRYPDGGHGAFWMLAPPPGSRLIDHPMIAGRWLEPDDEDAVVLNQLAVGQSPGVTVGDQVQLSLDGQPRPWRVVGIVEEIGSPGIAYVSQQGFRAAVGDQLSLLRIKTDAATAAQRQSRIRGLEQDLLEAGASVELAIPLAELRTAVGDHIKVLVEALLGMALIFAMVGGLGLTATMGISILERTRELGVLKAVGATPARIRRLVVAEALFLAGFSAVGAVALAIPLSLGVGGLVGQLAFRVGLPFVLPHGAVAGWLLVLGLLSGLATAWPAQSAARLSVRAALAHP